MVFIVLVVKNIILLFVYDFVLIKATRSAKLKKIHNNYSICLYHISKQILNKTKTDKIFERGFENNQLNA